MATTIYVDADACPVRDNIITIAIRHDVSVVMVCNGGIRPYSHPLITLKIVPSGPDAADKWIAETITPNDVLITSDIPLAAKAVENDAIVIKPDGSCLTKDNIGNILASRDLMSDIRAADPFHQSKSKPLSATDKGQFNQALDQALTKS